MTSRRLLQLLAPCTIALAGAAGASAAAAEAPPGQTPTGSPATPRLQTAPSAPEAQLSNEHTLTTWAHPLEAVPIYARPDTHTRRLSHLHLETEDGFDEVYLLLSSRTDAQGREWVKLRIPGRPNGRTGWVQRESLGSFHQTHWLVVINLRSRRLTAYFNGRRRYTAPVGVGKPSSPTPPGHFWIREVFRIEDRRNPYWPYALGTADYSTLTDWPGGGVVGIHGDFGEPQLIPGAPSHGCVRMHAADISWLGRQVGIGTPVDIL